MDSLDYLSYKKNKRGNATGIINNNNKPPKKTPKFFIQFFILTFALCFVLILNLTNKYTSKMDIEYDDPQSAANRRSENAILRDFGSKSQDDTKYTIDKRLFTIYNEEIGLSTARAVHNEDSKPIDLKQYEEIKNEQMKILREERRESEKSARNFQNKADYPLNEQDGRITTPALGSTKILVGKYATQDDARTVQAEIVGTQEFNSLKPFIRQVVKQNGSYYTVQVGSYTNLDIAKEVADKLQRAGYNVWVLQQ